MTVGWGPITATGTVATIGSSLTAAWNAYQNNNPDGVPTGGAVDQINAALAAVGTLTANGIVGQNVQATIEGHANVGHTPKAGLPNDQITITVVDIS